MVNLRAQSVTGKSLYVIVVGFVVGGWLLASLPFCVVVGRAVRHGAGESVRSRPIHDLRPIGGVPGNPTP